MRHNDERAAHCKRRNAEVDAAWLALSEYEPLPLEGWGQLGRLELRGSEATAGGASTEDLPGHFYGDNRAGFAAAIAEFAVCSPIIESVSLTNWILGHYRSHMAAVVESYTNRIADVFPSLAYSCTSAKAVSRVSPWLGIASGRVERRRLARQSGRIRRSER